MPAKPSFDNTARLGRISLLVGAYAPMLIVLGLRIGLGTLGWAFIAAGALATAWWLVFLLVVVSRRPRWEITVHVAEPVDRDVAAYVASYLLPVLAAKPEHGSTYAAYGMVAALILIVAYRADLGAVNPLAYLCGFRAYRVSADDDVRIVLSRSMLARGTVWEMQDAAGIVVAAEEVGHRDG